MEVGTRSAHNKVGSDNSIGALNMSELCRKQVRTVLDNTSSDFFF